MKIQSMTGFGRAETLSDNYNVLVEIKSVNNRFKDVRFKIPSSLNSQELLLRKKITDAFGRGSFDVYISVKKSGSDTMFDHLDFDKINSFINAFSKQCLNNVNSSMQLNPTDFLKGEFYKDSDTEQNEKLHELVGATFELAIGQLKQSREQEGAKLVSVLYGHLDKYKASYSKISAITERYQKSVDDKLRKRVADFSQELNLNESRLLQEVVFYLEKLDVHEEINRINAHLSKFNSILESGNEVGRQIDFLVQELGRETNTIGSKSGDTELSETVVSMKVQLEKIREQGLNLE